MRAIKASTPFCFLFLAVLLLSCDFRRPAEGYDSEWEPDHEHQANSQQTPSENMERPGGDDHSIAGASSSQTRPTQIAADTTGMSRVHGTWEMVGETTTEFTAYHKDGTLTMIVEQEGDLTRTYYYNSGALFYYNEATKTGAYEMTVEFDDIGDVLGARKVLNGERLYIDQDDFGAIVKHAVEVHHAAQDLMNPQ